MSISLRIGNEVYRRVVEAESMTSEQAEVAAHEIGVDIGALALYLKEQGLDKDYDNAMMVAQRFEQMANALAKQGLQKAASSISTGLFSDDYWPLEDHVGDWMEDAVDNYTSQYAGDPEQLALDAVDALNLHDEVDLDDDEHPIWDLAKTIAGIEEDFEPEPARQWDVVDSLRSRLKK